MNIPISGTEQKKLYKNFFQGVFKTDYMCYFLQIEINIMIQMG